MQQVDSLERDQAQQVQERLPAQEGPGHGPAPRHQRAGRHGASRDAGRADDALHARRPRRVEGERLRDVGDHRDAGRDPEGYAEVLHVRHYQESGIIRNF